MSEIIVTKPERKHYYTLGDFCQDKFGIYIVSKDEGELFTVRLGDGMCSWGIPVGAIWLPPKTKVEIEIS